MLVEEISNSEMICFFNLFFFLIPAFVAADLSVYIYCCCAVAASFYPTKKYEDCLLSLDFVTDTEPVLVTLIKSCLILA